MGELKRTPLRPVHQRIGAKMTGFAGYDMPVVYDGILAEHARVREAVGLFDVSHMGELRIRGPGALDAVNSLITNDIRRVGDGRAMYAATCTEQGTIVDDLIVYRLASDDVLVCVNASNREADFAHFRTWARGDAEVTDESDQWAQIAVQGPKAPQLLGRLWPDVFPAMKPFRVRSVTFEGVPLLVATTGYTGEPGGELYAPADVAVALWTRLMESGGDLGVGPVGLGARDTLRLEMAYCLYGNDIDRTTTPLEAGLAWVTRLDKPAFVGREALVAQSQAGVTRRLVGFELTERAIPRHGYAIVSAGETVGEVTSGTLSPSTGRAIGLAYVPIGLSDPGTTFRVDCRGRLRDAVVVSTPFYSKT